MTLSQLEALMNLKKLTFFAFIPLTTTEEKYF